jgi:hypothetical protein
MGERGEMAEGIHICLILSGGEKVHKREGR